MFAGRMVEWRRRPFPADAVMARRRRAMSTLQQLKTVIPGIEAEESEARTYECRSCGSEFESAKPPERVQCMDCLSSDVTVIDGH